MLDIYEGWQLARVSAITLGRTMIWSLRPQISTSGELIGREDINLIAIAIQGTRSADHG
jgi:hypothetical protein